MKNISFLSLLLTGYVVEYILRDDKILTEKTSLIKSIGEGKRFIYFGSCLIGRKIKSYIRYGPKTQGESL